jgi:CAAX prenyl protease-like protein
MNPDRTDHASATERPPNEAADPKIAAVGAAGAGDETPAVAPYIVPMFAYIALGGLETYLPATNGRISPLWYPLAYAARAAIVALLLWYYRATLADFLPLPRWRSIGLAVVLGLCVFGLWIGLDGHYPPIRLLGSRVGFDVGVLRMPERALFITARMLGLVVLVPLIEELFCRSFLVRTLINPNFDQVPIGTMTLPAALISAVLFALAHPEWLPAFLTGLIWAWLLWQTRSLAACFVSHAVANLALGIYVVATGDWKHW